MGVKGLISYLQKTGFKPDPTFFTLLLSQEGVCPNRLVIDTSSFIHHVCFAHSDWTFAGDYAVYKAYIKCYILLLNLVIGWDGSYRDPKKDFSIEGDISSNTLNKSWLLWVVDGPLPNSKVYTRCNRVKQKLETVNEILPHLEKLGCGHKQEFTREKIIPILAVEIFLETLKEMNQTIIMAEEEADQPAAFYARRFDAAVVSNDSDFIVYDLPHGFLYLPSFFVSESVLEALSRFDFYQTAISDSVVVFLQFKVLRYCNSKVCEHLKIKSLHFPLLVSLIGNDLTSEVVKQLLKAVATTFRNDSNNLGLHSRNHLHINKLVKCFRNLADQSFEQAFNTVQRVLNIPIAAAQLLKSSSLSYQSLKLLPQIKSLNPHISDYMFNRLLALYKGGILGPQTMEMVVHGRFWGFPLIESLADSYSSWELSAPLRLFLWALLGKFESTQSLQDLIPVSNWKVEARELSILVFEINEEKKRVFQALKQIVHSNSEESRVSPESRFWLLLNFLHCNPFSMPKLEPDDYKPLYSCSGHHVVFVLLLRYLAARLSPMEIPQEVLKGFVAMYALLCKGVKSYNGHREATFTWVDTCSAFSVKIKRTYMKFNNQFQGLVLSLKMFWELLIDGSHQTGPRFKLINRVDSRIFFYFCDFFSKNLPAEKVLNHETCLLFHSILPYLQY